MATVAIKASAATRTGFTWIASSLESGPLSVAGHSGGGVRCPALDGIGSAATVEGSFDNGASWQPIYDAAGAVAMTLANDTIVELPAGAFIAPMIRLVSATGPTGDAVFGAFLIT